MASRDLTQLHPLLKTPIADLIILCKQEGVDLLVTCTYRSSEEQDLLYAQSRTAPGPKVTNARGGQSKHNFKIDGQPASKAVDFVPVRNGKCVWDNSDPAWQVMGRIARKLGLDWAGDWKRFKEYPHVQLKE